MTVLEEVRNHIANNATFPSGMSGTVGKDVFAARIPAEVDKAVGVIDTGGGASSIGAPIRNLTFQVVVRHTSYADAMDLANSIRAEFHVNDDTEKTLYRLDGSGSRVLQSHAMQEPYNLGQDANGRYEIVNNYQFLIE